MTKRKYPQVDDIETQMKEFFDSIVHESDTICVIVTVAYIDHCLWSLLGTRMAGTNTKNGMLAPEGCLGDAWAKARMAYCLGEISKGMLNNIQLILQVRNLFAHSMRGVTFTGHDEVASKCESLAFPNNVQLPNQMPLYAPFWESMKRMDDKTSRGRFTIAALSTCQYLLNAARNATPIAVRSDHWDHPRH
jgi:hypothetical protein